MRERIEKALARVAREKGLDEHRLRTWVSFIAFCGLLERGLEEGTLENYHIKGGAALELRFGLSSRATKDIDIGLHGDTETRLEAFKATIVIGFDDFTFRLKDDPTILDKVDTCRLTIGLSYKGRGFQTFTVDLGPGDEPHDLVHPTVHGLEDVGIRLITPVRCLNLSVQVAQKFHAATDPTILADSKQNRARDILDTLLIDMLGQVDYREARLAAERTFAERGTHLWPPDAMVYPQAWLDTLRALAGECGFPVTNPSDIVIQFQRLVGSVAAFSSPSD